MVWVKFHLPRKLRERIWEYTIAEEAADFVLGPGMKHTQFFYSNSPPPAPFIRRSYFNEAFLVWVRTRNFQFRFNNMMPPSFVWWMDNIGCGRAWANVKRMSFTAALRTYQPDLYAGLGVSNVADLVARATTLKHLTIILAHSLLYFDMKTGYFTHIRPIDKLREALDLRNILRWKRLQSLTLLCCPNWKRGRCIEADDLGCARQDLFLVLCNWFCKAFREQSRTVAIQGKLKRDGKKLSAEPESNRIV
jgi:hypothetical protein